MFFLLFSDLRGCFKGVVSNSSQTDSEAEDRFDSLPMNIIGSVLRLSLE